MKVVHSPSSNTYAALLKLVYTVAIAYDLNDTGFCERYCFNDYSIADSELENWVSRNLNDQCPVGWIACRGVHPHALKRRMEKYYGAHYARDVLDCYTALIRGKLYNQIHRDTLINQHIAKSLGISVDDVEHKLAYLRLSDQTI